MNPCAQRSDSDEETTTSEVALTTPERRTLDDAANLPENVVNPDDLQGIKHRESVARVGGSLYAFDDLCTCAEEKCTRGGMSVRRQGGAEGGGEMLPCLPA